MAATKITANFNADVTEQDISSLEALAGGFKTTSKVLIRANSANIEVGIRHVSYDANGSGGDGTLILRQDAV